MKTRQNISIDSELLQRLRDYVKHSSPATNMSAVIEAALIWWLDRNDKTKGK
jgi:post-segregation antitoxin (ccd killing protein)